ncbi:MAG: hypothetical protein CMC79_03355 [Flavobacteriaceae bacterium]|nr:hypothetical protein [Flavobacteriaceae bacterium]|tara:strand:- start:23955 stop:25439 length:1485 start_codon:yes stop_codon:yes gene_type:complete
MKKILALFFAKYIHWNNSKWINNPIKFQDKILKKLIKKAKNTKFGKDHSFNTIINYSDYKSKVPINDYEKIRPYIEMTIKGQENILWPGKPIYFAKTSGTTSGSKFIPITKESMPSHVKSSRDAILNYINLTGNTSFIKGKHIFLQGSPILKTINGIKIGRLSGIVAHYVPSYLRKNNMPSWETNCIDDWEKKIKKIVEETINEKMTIIGGIPSWVQMYFEKIIEKSKKPVGKQFPELSLFIYGGVNFDPYKSLFNKLLGKKIDSLEFFPASEGFIAYQDKVKNEGLLLLVNNGIFYEFIEANKFFSSNPERISLKDVKMGVNYVVILSTNAGLWSYNIGDTITFVSISPYRITVTGRIKHFISAFGEHVIGKEVETAIKNASSLMGAEIREFSVAPQVNPSHGLPYHEWFIDFKTPPSDFNLFSEKLDQEMCAQNIYYDDLIKGKVLRKAVIKEVKKGEFLKYMKSVGKLGGQNKIPRLSNNRNLVEKLQVIN